MCRALSNTRKIPSLHGNVHKRFSVAISPSSVLISFLEPGPWCQPSYRNGDLTAVPKLGDLNFELFLIALLLVAVLCKF